MSESIDTIRTQLWEKMRDKPYRDTFVAAHLSTNIAAQLQTIREQRGWSKKLLAQKAGMSPSRITVMEDPSYERFTLSTLKRLASAFDVALIARFTPFSDLVDWVAELSPEKLEASEFEKDFLSKTGEEASQQPKFIETAIETPETQPLGSLEFSPPTASISQSFFHPSQSAFVSSSTGFAPQSGAHEGFRQQAA